MEHVQNTTSHGDNIAHHESNASTQERGKKRKLEAPCSADKTLGKFPGPTSVPESHPYHLYLSILDEDSSDEEDMPSFDFRGVVPRQRRRRKFEETISPTEYRQRFRVPPEVVDFLEEKLDDVLTYPTLRNNPMSAREQILMFLFFTGTNSLYHVVKEARGPVESTVCRTLKRYYIIAYISFFYIINVTMII